MESNNKGNTVLLTVIGVATLLVALVGATFAYFTATVSTDTQSVSVATTTLASVTMAYGDAVTTDNAYPGYVDGLELKMSFGAVNTSDTYYKITVTTEKTMTSTPKFYLFYKGTESVTKASDVGSTFESNSFSYTGTSDQGRLIDNFLMKKTESGTTSYYYENSYSASNYGTLINTGGTDFNGTEGSDYFYVKVPAAKTDSAHYFYLVVQYANGTGDTADQNADQGKSFSAEVGVTEATAADFGTSGNVTYTIS